MRDLLSFWTTLIYALLLGAGGLMGYASKGSLPSLYSGLISAICMLASSFAILKSPRAGRNIALTFAALLTLLFLYRTILTYKLVPISMAFLSALVVAILIFRRKPSNL